MLTKVGWMLATSTPSLPSHLRANVEQQSQPPATYRQRTELQEVEYSAPTVMFFMFRFQLHKIVCVNSYSKICVVYVVKKFSRATGKQWFISASLILFQFFI